MYATADRSQPRDRGSDLTSAAFQPLRQRQTKSIRLYSGALPILKWIDEGEYYDIISNGHNMPMNDQHLDRNHRVAEVLAVCRDAGIETFPHNLPNFQRDEFDTIIPLRQPFFMTSRMLKWFGGDDAANKTNFTRLVGTLFIGETDYFVDEIRAKETLSSLKQE